MGFLTRRNFPETLGGSYTKKWKIDLFDLFSAWSDVSLVSNFLVCYEGYQRVSLTNISSRFEKPVNSYVESTIQILEIIFCDSVVKKVL